MSDLDIIAYVVDGGTTALLIWLLYTERTARQSESKAFREFTMRMIEYVAEITANRNKADNDTRNLMRPPLDKDEYFKSQE